MDHIYNRIRHILETTPGLTQKGLAERMGLNPAAVNRMLYGRRNIMADEIPIIEDYLGVRLNLSAPTVPCNIEYRQDAPPGGKHGFSDVPAQSFSIENIPPPMVPVKNISNGDVVDWVTRHPAQFGINKAFAIYVFSDSMEPRYFRGELVYIHPGRPPEVNRDCVIEMKNGDVYIKRCLRQGEKKIRVAQFNPPEEKELRRDDIKAIYTVVGRG